MPQQSSQALADAATAVTKQRPEVGCALARAQLVRDLLGGTPGMCEAGERYLPRRNGEDAQKWKARLSDAILHNAYRRTRDYLAGQVFCKDVVVGDQGQMLPAVFEAMREDADLQGNNLSVWAGKFFCDAVDARAQLILVDFPRVKTRNGSGGRLEYFDETAQQWAPKTAEADAAHGWRPYFVAIPLCHLLGWRFEMQNGKRVLTQLRFKERVLLTAGQFDTDDTYVEQVRVLYPGRYEIWRNTSPVEGKEVWTVVENGPVSLPVIPVAAFLPGERKGDELATAPALEDLAQLNRRHWQATAEHNELMRWVRAPGQFGSGFIEDEAKSMAWGPGVLSWSSSPEAKIQAIGTDASSVTASRQELEDLEDAMALYGLQLLMPQTGTATATEKALSASESDSTLKRWALGLKDCLEQAFVYAALWVGMDAEQAPSIVVNTEFHMLTGVDPLVIITAVDKGVIPKQLAFEEFKRRGLLPDDADWTEAKRMFDDQNSQGTGPTGASPDALAQRLLAQSQKNAGQLDVGQQAPAALPGAGV